VPELPEQVDTTAAISERYTASSLNAILLTPDALYAISFHNRSMVPAAIDPDTQLDHGSTALSPVFSQAIAST
jgi:hypothetical protein